MLRHRATLQASCVAPPQAAGATQRRAWRAVAARVVQILAIPFVAPAVLLAGALFLVLLPICGVASIAEGIATYGWRFCRRALSDGERLPQG